MRPAVIIVLAALIVALLAFDAYEFDMYEYDGHYREVAWAHAKYGAEQIERQVDNLLGSHHH